MKILETSAMKAELEDGDLISREHNVVKIGENVYEVFPKFSDLGTNKVLLYFLSEHRVPENIKWEGYKAKK